MSGARQLLVLGVALCLWACVGRSELLIGLLAYGVAVALLSSGTSRALLSALSTRQISLLALLLAAPGLAFVYRSHEQLAENEGWHGLTTQLSDRLRLELLPSIAPALLSSDRPQTFFVLAPDAKQVKVRFGQSTSVVGESMGHGLFRIDYDPRRDGFPQAQHGKARVSIYADERSVVRELHASTPLAHPRWLALSPDRTLAATVSEETDELVVVDKHGIRMRTAVGDGPSDCAFLSDSQLLVSHLDDSSLRLISLENLSPAAEVELGARQTRLALSPDRGTVAVALAGAIPAIAFVTADQQPDARLRIRERVVLDAIPDWLAFGTDEKTLIVSTRRPAQIVRLRLSTSGYRVDLRLALARPVVTLARSADGNQLILAVTDYEPHGKASVGNHFVQDQLLTMDVASMQIREPWLTARRSARQSKAGDVDRGISPMGMAASGVGDWLVAFAGSDEIWRKSAASQARALIDLVHTPLHAPHGVAELSDGTLVVASPSAGALGLIAPGSSKPRLLRLAPDDSQLLSRDRHLLAQRVGERGFFEATRSGISCQSCHLHADSDEASHNLGGYVLVPTLSVRGIAATAPYLRDGSYPKLADLDELAQGLYRGYLRSQGARGETLQAYLNSLPRPRHPELSRQRDLAREKRGLSVFVKARCPSCHAMPAFTNLGRVPMHSMFPEQAAKRRAGELLDTPSLLSVGASPPYLSDGRAVSLDAVISTHNPRNLHGDTQSLSDAERSNLVAFLSSL